MKHETTRVIPARTIPEKREQVFDKFTCDLCGRASTDANDFDGVNWADGYGAVDRVRIERSTGYSYPEGGSQETVLFDVCPDCWERKVVPLMESHGAKPRTKSTEW